ncbi:hypothetical protein F4806DRAFT_492795 [Annulohypoxylon nitens]|nr:hypothetical protein F4806DRAFT_492795 [Annulohypoxylon nitens]
MAFPSFPHYATKLLFDFNLSTCGNLAKEAYRRKGVSASRRISAYISVSQRQSSLAKHGIMQLATPTPGIQMDQMDESLHLDTPRFQISDFLQVSQACHLYLTYVYHPPLVGRHPSSIIHRPLLCIAFLWGVFEVRSLKGCGTAISVIGRDDSGIIAIQSNRVAWWQCGIVAEWKRREESGLSGRVEKKVGRDVTDASICKDLS